MPSAHAAPPSVWDRGAQGTYTFLRETRAITEGEVRKLLHDPLEILSRVAQPIIWLMVFAPVFSNLGVTSGQGMPYKDFLAPGVLAQGVLFVSVMYGVALLWERDMGILQKFLASPASRRALVLGKSLAAGLRNLPTAAIVYVVATLASAKMRWSIGPIFIVMLIVVLGSAVFCTFSMIAACIVKQRERFMGVAQLLTAPVFFASNALYPVSLMPPWLRAISEINPLSYVVDGLRGEMLAKGHSAVGVGKDLLVLTVLLLIATEIGARLYPRVEQ